MDIIEELGALAFASRLKRLSEQLQKDVTKLYRILSVDFQARWFAVAHLLRQSGAMPVTEIAASLKLTHPAINQVASEMERAGIVSSRRDRKDERRRLIGLTKKGLETFSTLEPVWREVEAATQEIIKTSGVNLLRALGKMEHAVSEESVLDRCIQNLKPMIEQKIRIVDYKAKYKKYFRSLNEEWLNEYFTIEPEDAKILKDPNRSIIRKGGIILFAELGGEIVATTALIRTDKRVFELAKMGVSHNFRSLGIGRKLCDAALKRAKRKGAREVFLLTSPRLASAIRLYKSCGFLKSSDTNHPVPYGRETIIMKRSL